MSKDKGNNKPTELLFQYLLLLLPTADKPLLLSLVPVSFKRFFFTSLSEYFPVKQMQVSVEEFISCSDTNKDANMDTKEGMKKEIQKRADLITLTPPLPPPPFR